jgi:RNA polymerase subunit RPABC4/transcription elongation factor Spt4
VCIPGDSASHTESLCRECDNAEITVEWTEALGIWHTDQLHRRYHR